MGIAIVIVTGIVVCIVALVLGQMIPQIINEKHEFMLKMSEAEAKVEIERLKLEQEKVRYQK